MSGLLATHEGAKPQLGWNVMEFELTDDVSDPNANVRNYMYRFQWGDGYQFGVFGATDQPTAPADGEVMTTFMESFFLDDDGAVRDSLGGVTSVSEMLRDSLTIGVLRERMWRDTQLWDELRFTANDPYCTNQPTWGVVPSGNQADRIAEWWVYRERFVWLSESILRPFSLLQ